MTPNRIESATAIASPIVDAELSLGPRIAHGALLSVALAATVVVTALWLTEPDLPYRTRAALIALSLIGATWASYALWVLMQRRVLFARQRLVAGWIAVAFTSVFTAGAFAIAIFGNHASGLAAGAMGLALLAVAGRFLVRARTRLNALQERLRELEAMHGGAA
ncbi:hypothetical protein ABS767_09090 [Sphingomonas sp. ST-64]|uniref:Uncharacterized protein n=1 Tax=Sphingomonas plantiphila TaxID=3163295 RepID=A0ABW8YPF5_9SPHN